MRGAQATVVALEGSKRLCDYHFAALLRANISNVALGNIALDGRLLKNLYESPEFFRFQVCLAARALRCLGARAALCGPWRVC